MDSHTATPLGIGQCATLACLLEASAAKPGNVHRGADFEDLTYLDLITSAVLIGPILEEAHGRPLGETILQAITATQAAVDTNTNLGIVLLLAPLATVPRETSSPETSLVEGVGSVLAALDEEDARKTYEAVRLAKPGGLGTRDQADVAQSPSVGLIEAMQMAAERDLVARQYASGYKEVFELVVPWLCELYSSKGSLNDVIVEVHLRLMREFPDSLILRKCGLRVAREASDRAATVLSLGGPEDEIYQQGLAEFDFWLRSDGHRRNPGTTADLIAAGLFVALRSGSLRPPFRFTRG